MINLDEITAGSWPDWFAAVGTSAAFIVAAVSYARSVKVHRQEQASLVYSRVLHIVEHLPGTEFELLPHEAQHGAGGDGADFLFPVLPGEEARYRARTPVFQVTAVIRNSSKQLIGPARIQVLNSGAGKVYDTFSASVDAVEPEKEWVVSFVFPNEHHPGQPSLGTTLLFRDAVGRWWRRRLAEPIEAVHNDPENAAPLPAERAQYAANARVLGIAPSPEPKVPLRARWHRFWRKRRGKTPVP